MTYSKKLFGHGVRALVVALSLAVAFSGQAALAISDYTRDSIYKDSVWYVPNSESGALCGSSATGGASNSLVIKSFTLGTDAKERRINLIKALMADYNLTAEQAAGPVGNFMLESGGHHLPPDINQGTSEGAPPRLGELGYGWAQWSGGRQRTFITFAVENGYMASENVRATDAANYAYLKKELSEGYQETIQELRTQSSPEDAAVSFEATFERAGVPALEGRMANARQAFEEYREGNSSPSRTTPCSTNAAIVGSYAFPLLGTKSTVENPGIFSNNTTNTAGHPYTAYDILAKPGTPVVAFLSGTVERISEDKCPGRFISIYNHESDLTISYLHLDFNNHAALGDQVVAGQQIGLVGAGPNGCGTPHLHIDAAKGERRPGCAREYCPTANQRLFVDIGPQLYETYQVLPD